MVSLGGLSQNSGYQDRSPERSPGTSSHTYPGEMKMNDEKTVSNENVFQTRFLVCGFQLKLEMCSSNGSMVHYLSWTSQHVVMWDMVYWCCSVAIAQWWHKDGKAEKPCLSIKLHRAEGKQQDMVRNDYVASLPIRGRLRVFHALVWTLIGYVWNLVVWVQILVVVNDRLAFSYFGVQHDCPRRGVKVWREDVQCTEPRWTYLNIFKPILEQCMCMWT